MPRTKRKYKTITRMSRALLTPELIVLHLERPSPHEKPMALLLPGKQSGLSEKAATALPLAWLWLLLRRHRASREEPQGSLGVPGMPREPAPPRSPPPPAPGLRMLPSFGVGLFSEKTKSPSSLLFQAQHPRCVDCTPFMGETVSWAGVRPSVRLQRQDQFTVIFLSHLGAWGKVRSH